ncbi:MAG TPA: hypothetical protein VGC24_10890, partial [Burkholderiaceae bacterium]
MALPAPATDHPAAQCRQGKEEEEPEPFIQELHLLEAFLLAQAPAPVEDAGAAACLLALRNFV